MEAEEVKPLLLFLTQEAVMSVHFVRGNSKFVFTVAHDGVRKIRSAQTRSETLRWEEEGGEDPRDAGTLELAFRCRELMSRHGGMIPTILWVDLHRSHVDMNRAPSAEPFANGFGGLYRSFHDVLDEAVIATCENFGSCVLADFHGFVHQPGSGTHDIVVGSDEHKTCPSGFDRSFVQSLRDAYDVVFSPDEARQISSRYRGGWIVRRVATRFGKRGLESIQLEFSRRMRSASSINKIAASLAVTFINASRL